MARGINKVILIGNLGNDPEQKSMPSGNAVTNITVATTESWKDKQTGQPVEKTEWHRVVFFNRLAEIAGQYLTKGSKVYIEGRLQTRKWQDQSGQDRYTTEIVANEMQMLDGRGQQGGDVQQQGGYQQQAPQQQAYQQPAAQQTPQQPAAQQPAPQSSQQQASYQQPAPQQQGGYQQQQAPQAPSAPAGNFDDFDDDIPF